MRRECPRARHDVGGHLVAPTAQGNNKTQRRSWCFLTRNPTPNPSPQGGGEQTEFAACTDSISARHSTSVESIRRHSGAALSRFANREAAACPGRQRPHGRPDGTSVAPRPPRARSWFERDRSKHASLHMPARGFPGAGGRGRGTGLRRRHVGVCREPACQQRGRGLGAYPRQLGRRAPAHRRLALTALARDDPALSSAAAGLARARHCRRDLAVGEGRSQRAHAGKTATVRALKPAPARASPAGRPAFCIQDPMGRWIATGTLAE